MCVYLKEVVRGVHRILVANGVSADGRSKVQIVRYGRAGDGLIY